MMTKSHMISLEQIMKAQQNLKGTVAPTPYMNNYNLSKKYDCNIMLKREDMQVVRSFKIRGAYNKMCSLTANDLSRGIVCASAGNHAQGVAFACKKLGTHGTIYMPSTTPNQKIKKVKQFGQDMVKVILIGDTYDDASEAAYIDATKNRKVMIHPFDDPEVIAGQATIAVEMLEQSADPLDYLFVAVGGGGLISGVGSYMKTLSPQTKIIAVEAAGAAALKASVDANERVTLDSIDSFADGIAVRQIGRLTYEICKEVVDDYVTIPEGHICSTLLQLYNDEAIVVEPAGAISVSALDQYKDQIKGKNVGIIICGGNNDITRTEEIKERALLYEGKKHYFIVRFPQRAGALRDFLSVLGPNDDIAHFQYTKKNSRQSGPALVGIELKNVVDYEPLIHRMNKEGIDYQPINNNRMLLEILV